MDTRLGILALSGLGGWVVVQKSGMALLLGVGAAILVRGIFGWQRPLQHLAHESAPGLVLLGSLYADASRQGRWHGNADRDHALSPWHVSSFRQNEKERATPSLRGLPLL
jgi:hypothetical protein